MNPMVGTGCNTPGFIVRSKPLRWWETTRAERGFGFASKTRRTVSAVWERTRSWSERRRGRRYESQERQDIFGYSAREEELWRRAKVQEGGFDGQFDLIKPQGSEYLEGPSGNGKRSRGEQQRQRELLQVLWNRKHVIACVDEQPVSTLKVTATSWKWPWCSWVPGTPIVA